MSYYKKDKTINAHNNYIHINSKTYYKKYKQNNNIYTQMQNKTHTQHAHKRNNKRIPE